VVFVFLRPESPAFFSGIKGKQEKSKLSVLCVSAVNIIQAKTLSGSPFKPPFSGVVVDPVQKQKRLFMAPFRGLAHTTSYGGR
jgi:hypothetical protein